MRGDVRLSRTEVGATGEWIASIQLPNGMIPWFSGGHADPWNHVEASMALVVAGRQSEAESALRWLASRQHDDGSWCMYYLADGIEDSRRDPNVGAYVATGTWFHYLSTGEPGLLEELWPVIDHAMGFVLRMQRRGGEVLWSIGPDGTAEPFALLAGSASIHHSLRCALAGAKVLGHERPEWELAAARMANAIARCEGAFEPKERWAMDWYYPVLCGAVSGAEAQSRLFEGWDTFVLPGLGVRCVSDQPWVTGAETAESAMAHDCCGLIEEARVLLDWTRHLRDDDGGYWTGCVHPQCVRFPGGERTTYTAAAVVLADHALYGRGRSAGLFRGEALPAVLHLPTVEERVGDGC